MALPNDINTRELNKFVETGDGNTAVRNSAGVYNASAPTYTDGQSVESQFDENGNLKTREQYAPGYEDNTAGVAKVEERSTYVNISADTAVATGAGRCFGFYVNSTSSGTIKLYDNTAASGTVVLNTVTPAVGFHRIPGARFSTGLYADIANTIDVTFFIAQ
jgi:hypothetical protein